MTALQQLTIAGCGLMPVGAEKRGRTRAWFYPGVESMIELLRVVGSLRGLEKVCLDMWVDLNDAGVQRLSGMLDQLLPDYMVPCCKVTVDKVSIGFKES
jgi:hypothetical protein